MTGDPLDDQFGSRIREWREARGWSQQVLAGRVGFSQGKVSDLENGRNRPVLTPSDWVRLAEVFGTSIEVLIGLPDPAASIARWRALVAVTDDLTDSDIEALTITARQLASARAAALPSREDFPGWETLSPQARAAFEELEGAVRRAARLRVAEPKATYRAGGNAGGSDGRPRGRRSPGGAASA